MASSATCSESLAIVQCTAAHGDFAKALRCEPAGLGLLPSYRAEFVLAARPLAGVASKTGREKSVSAGDRCRAPGLLDVDVVMACPRRAPGSLPLCPAGKFPIAALLQQEGPHHQFNPSEILYCAQTMVLDARLGVVPLIYGVAPYLNSAMMLS